MNRLFIFILVASFLCSTCRPGENNTATIFQHAERQAGLMLDSLDPASKRPFPKSVREDGGLSKSNVYGWTSGFFPGVLWYLYEYTGNEKWKSVAEEWTGLLEPVSHFSGHHDVGFMINCSYGNGFRLTGNDSYKKVIVRAAESLCKRYNPEVGCIQSWNVDKGWQAERGWKYPVIIDNMMNLELLFRATALSGDSSFFRVAITHADNTLENHFRANHSSYHVVDYDPATGEVRKKQRAQGYSDESAWARGQAWGLYGFVLCYRETRYPRYLQQAERIAKFIMDHPNLPEDKVPYWDFDAPDIPDTYRDASAAAIIASALFELARYSARERSSQYRELAGQILASLSSPVYLAKTGSNNGFLLTHSVGSIPHQVEIDVPLIYADYYYLEALLRSEESAGDRRDNLAFEITSN